MPRRFGDACEGVRVTEAVLCERDRFRAKRECFEDFRLQVRPSSGLDWFICGLDCLNVALTVLYVALTV